MNLLIPGRHHLLTDFQFKYILYLIQNGLDGQPDVYGEKLCINEKIESVIFAVTSANHSNTRRNPLSFHLRAMALQLFSHDLDISCLIYGIDDVGLLSNFADYTIKKILHESDGRFDLKPENTIVVCSTGVLSMYQALGFMILPAELDNIDSWSYKTELPWEVVEKIASSDEWTKDSDIFMKIHISSLKIWNEYDLGKKVRMLFQDKLIGEDGDITSTRDYNSYVRQMDEIASLKYDETKTFIKPGRIGDIGCAVGSWIKLACEDQKFHESDFYGIEVARHLFDICCQRKNNGEFANPYVFFSQKNAVTGLVFNANSMNTINTSSLTHEIYSYGSKDDLLRFIKNRYLELTNGGVWINRDVVGPDNKDEIVYMEADDSDGANEYEKREFSQRDELKKYLEGLSTYAKFLKFADEYRKDEGYKVEYKTFLAGTKKMIILKCRDACDFAEKKDYLDNWKSEMHESFCFNSFIDWKTMMQDAGFSIDQRSYAFRNEWIVKNRLEGKIKLYRMKDDRLLFMEFPVTHMILIGNKR